jgi:hypothetical protein
MRKLAWLVTALAALAVGCVDAEPDRTNVVIEREAPPSSTTIVKDDGENATPPGDTNVDIDVDTTDETPDVVIE